MPAAINPAVDLQNVEILQQRLNDPDAFDIALQPKERDRLQITFNLNDNDDGCLIYCFAFRKGKWVRVEYDSFDLASRFREMQSGKIKSALKNKRL